MPRAILLRLDAAIRYPWTIESWLFFMSSFPPLNENDFEIDLWGDVGKICAAELAGMGYKSVSSSDPQELCIQYLNALFRRVDPRPRKFHQSTELKVPPDLLAGYESLKEKIEKGQELTPHLSGLLEDIDFNDPLLNAWKIHHFHLGTKPHPKNPNLVERSGPILLGMVQENDFYAIDIIEHGSKGNPEVFYEQDLIEILHNNWPTMMDRYRINGKAAGPKPSNAEIKLARDAGITVFSQTNDGTLYLPTVGFTSVGGTTKDTSGQIIFQVMRIVRAVNLLQKLIVEKISALELCFSKTGGIRPYKIVLTHFLDGITTAREESSLVGMRVSQFCGEPGEEWLDVWLDPS